MKEKTWWFHNVSLTAFDYIRGIIKSVKIWILNENFANKRVDPSINYPSLCLTRRLSQKGNNGGCILPELQNINCNLVAAVVWLLSISQGFSMLHYRQEIWDGKVERGWGSNSHSSTKRRAILRSLSNIYHRTFWENS